MTIIRNVAAFLILLSVIQCGYVEKDGTKYHKTIVGNIPFDQQQKVQAYEKHTLEQATCAPSKSRVS